MAVTLPVGYQFGGYVIKSLVGRGGMGVVYAAEHTTLQRRVALKVIVPEMAEDEAFRDRFLREARLAASLRHPNIIDIYDAGQVDGELYLAMRFVEGASLATVLRLAGRLEPDRALPILAKVAGALDEAHANGLVHRDVKPDNVLLGGPSARRPSEEVFLTDFGLVRPIDARAGATRVGAVLGTLSYMAPEMLDGSAVDGRSDQYSLACVLYECLVGQVPFDRELDAAVLMAHLTVPPPPVTAARPDLPARLDTVVARGMAKRKEDRYGSCVELIDAALAALSGSAIERDAPPVWATEIIPAPPPGPGPEASRIDQPGLGPTAPVVAPSPPAPASGSGTGPTVAGVRARRSRLPIGAALAIGLVAVGVAVALAVVVRPGVLAPSSAPPASSARGPSPAGSVGAVPSRSPAASPSAVTTAHDPTWHETGPLAQARWGHGATRLADGRVLVVGGNTSKNSASAVASAELYDPRSGSWTSTATMSQARSYPSVTLLDDGSVLVAGGAEDNVPLAIAELYDPVAGTWAALPAMHVPRLQHTATLLDDGRVLVTGGGTSKNDRASTASAEIYDPKTRAWTRTGSMAVPRSYHTATRLEDGRVLVTGGSSTSVGAGTVRASAEIFDPGTGRWTTAAPMAAHRYVHEAVSLADGRVLVAGGWSSATVRSKSLASAEIFDPRTKAWATVGAMSTGRAQFRMAALPDGRVVAVGGLGPSNDPLAGTDLFDPAAGSWSPTGAMADASWWPALVVLEDGRALVAGGASDASGAAPLASAELYGPP